MSVITFGGFMIIPDLANYLISNVQLNSGELRWVYLIGGGATLFTINGGRLADQFGRMRIFTIMMFCSIVAAFVSTHLPERIRIEAANLRSGSGVAGVADARIQTAYETLATAKLPITPAKLATRALPATPPPCAGSKSITQSC
jgi:predicted MFS family arabinose efflux permease